MTCAVSDLPAAEVVDTLHSNLHPILNPNLRLAQGAGSHLLQGNEKAFANDSEVTNGSHGRFRKLVSFASAVWWREYATKYTLMGLALLS